MRTITRLIPYNSITTFRVSLESAGTGNLQTSPTLAAGDVKISKDGGAEANLNTLPAVDGTNTRQVNVTVSATESSTGEVRILFADQTSPKEWDDLEIVCLTYGNASANFPYVNDSRLANLDATVSSRLSSAGYTAPLDAAGVRSAVGLASANLDTQLTAIDDYLDTEVAAIKAKTDQLTFTAANVVDANIQRINDVVVNGDGSATPWGP